MAVFTGHSGFGNGGGLMIETGTYTGNSNSSQRIGLEIDADVVIVFPTELGSQTVVLAAERGQSIGSMYGGMVLQNYGNQFAVASSQGSGLNNPGTTYLYIALGY